MDARDILKLNACARYQDPSAAGMAPKQHELAYRVEAEALNRIDRELEKLQVRASENIIRETTPTLDTIIVPDWATLEWSMWKLKDGRLVKIIKCDREELLEIITDLIEKIKDLQKKIPPRGMVTVDTVKHPATDITRKALGLI